MYIDTLSKAREIIEQASKDNSTVFIATISPDGNSGNVAFIGDSDKMVKLLTSLLKLADQRKDGEILKEVVIEAFAQNIVNIE